jgi:Peptidase M50B-like
MAAPPMKSELARIGQLQAHLPGPVSMALGLAALAAVVMPDLASFMQHVEVMAHEGAHAVVGSAFGRRVTAIRLFRNGTGRTVLAPDSGAGLIIAGIAGYLGPSGFGLAAAELIRIGHSVAVLWLALLLIVTLLAPLRWCFGVASVTVTALVLFLVVRYASLGVQITAAYGLSWFLMLAGVRTVLRHGTDAQDAHVLKRLTSLPRGFWHVLWLVGSLLALGTGGSLLL